MRRFLFFFMLISLSGFSQNSEESSDSVAAYIEAAVADTINSLPAIEAVIFSEKDAAQQNQTKTQARYFNKQKYEKTIEGFDYKEKIIKKEKKKDVNYNFKTPTNKSYLGIFQVILILVIAIALILIIYLILKQNTKNTRVNNEEDNWNIVDLEKTEKPIEIIDLKIKEAIAAQNYTLAIRLYYLKTIATLYFNKWILWKKDKTNATYCNELFNTNYYLGFSELTLHFEYTWFGKRKIDAPGFDKIESDFKEYIVSIKWNELEKKSEQ